MAAPTYTINVAMSAATVSALATSRAVLYVFRAVQNSDAAGRPVVWMAVNQYGQNTPVRWIEQYQAWTAPASALTSPFPIAPGATAPVLVGQTAQVTSGGSLAVLNQGAAGAVAVSNTTTLQFTTGLSVSTGSTYAPVCAFPLYGGNLQVITPLLTTALMFSTQPMTVGSVYAPPLAASQPQTMILAVFAPALGSISPAPRRTPAT